MSDSHLLLRTLTVLSEFLNIDFGRAVYDEIKRAASFAFELVVIYKTYVLKPAEHILLCSTESHVEPPRTAVTSLEPILVSF